MKLLAFTDIHENLSHLARIKRAIKEENVDLVICTGDFTVFGGSVRKMLQAMDNLGVPCVLIPGNHEDADEVEQEVQRCKNITSAHERFVEVMGLQFFGFGGRGFHTEEPELAALEKKHAAEFNERTIVLCHAPPHGTALDEVEPGWHVGNSTLTELIRRRKPMLVLTGHIHECFHQHDSLAGVTLINPGPDGEIIEIDD